MNCFLCDKSLSKPYFTVGSHAFEQCVHCGLVFVANFSRLGASYQNEEYFVQKNEYVQRWDEFCALFEQLLDKIARHKRQGVFLDVGAGVGALLHVARQRGFAAHGVELSDWASAYARNEHKLDVVQGTLQEAAYPDAYFDVIVINHVIEHVSDPLEMLREAHRVLKEDGLLVIGVPNVGSIMARLLRERWPSLRPDEHIWHFTPSTLRKMAQRSGFHEIHFEARDNYSVQGWGMKDMVRRIINRVSVLTDRSEAMLLFAQKQPIAGNHCPPAFGNDGPVRGRR